MAKQPLKLKQRKAIWVWLAGFILLAGFIVLYIFYNKIYGPNVAAGSDGKEYLYVHTNSDFPALVNNLEKNQLLRSTDDFVWAAHFYKYGRNIKPGKYRLKSGMSNKEIIRMLQLGKQEPVELVLHGLRLKENLAGFVSHRLEADSLSLLGLLNDPKFADSLGYSVENIYTVFIPNTYQFKWNTSAKEFLSRMNRESKRFWNADRVRKASEAELNVVQAMILASIVTQESNKADEMPLIAGVYLNRLHQGIKLDADPTVIFANNDFSIKRVTRQYLMTPSPYNTYRNAGLPPGPITMPTIPAIEGVLNYRKTDYMFFCAKDDFSGYHAFAATREEHMINAHRFQKALDERNIH